MKKVLCCFILGILFIEISVAQTSQTNISKQKPSNEQLYSKRSKKHRHSADRATASSGNTPVYTAASSSSNNAYITPGTYHYQIEDPTLRALNERANGENVRVSKSGIVGEPKRAYGFAKGHITFYTASAPSSGTMTGSGAVGTGTTPGALGTNTSAAGVNGKSPYAGNATWGTQGLQPDPRIRDSVTTRHK